MMGVALSPLLIFCGVLVIMGNLLSISSSSWLGVWLGMEINLFGFLIMMNPEGCCVAQSGVKYFVTQSIGSMLLLFGFFLVFSLFNSVGAVVIMMGLLMKTGIFPFHNWVPDVVMVSSWLIGCLILTWQKLAPFSFFSFFPGSWFLITSLVFMSLVGCLGGLNQNSVRGMAVYSSFVHNSWMMLSLLYSFSVFFVYYLIYSLSVMVFFFSCWTLSKSSMMSYSISWMGMLSLLMLSGVPPFMGFFMKLIVVLSCPIMLLIICLLSSVVSLKFYMSFFYSMILNSSEKSIYCVKSGVLFLAFSLANFIMGSISMSYFIW
uniref:NADH-ubiquinone oxidoreductase chain 2 n=1 Tax=Perna canaliculus TaxID=38949 RepID=A0A7S8J287_PERCI|nr:NADH dehydrogenase subunit 2 [Perna canaliculus]QPD06653.1 NADH dehydrogenase subunit 2 [Perna canaliculus]QPD06666.1 NADH dehydrogenase subunit 2 [Perna canaliculus]UJM44253.1 NADH dehydrogenase subunit 2 [Perna canaliculus]